MKNLLLLFLFFSISYTSFAQQNNEKISLQFENSSKIDVINQIEDLTDYHFYFIESWLDDALISGNYNNVPLNTILNDIFKDTVINFYISTDNEVVSPWCIASTLAPTGGARSATDG